MCLTVAAKNCAIVHPHYVPNHRHRHSQPPQLEALAPQPVAEMVANVSRINGACQLLQADRSAQVAPLASCSMSCSGTCVNSSS